LYKIINTGGTFNKRYDPVKGELFVPADAMAVEEALKPIGIGCEIAVKGVLYKDSLEMDDADRELLCDEVCSAGETGIVVVHGTDTMHKSAAAIDARLGKDGGKRVVLTGAMVPFSIDPVEAVANLSSAVTALNFLEPGVYISMHGVVLPYRNIVKNRRLGIFERVD